MKTNEILTAQEYELFEIDKDTELYEHFYEEDDEKLFIHNENELKVIYARFALITIGRQGFYPFVRIVDLPNSEGLLSICIRLNKRIFFIIRLIREGDFLVKKNYSSTKCIISPIINN